MPHTGPHGCGNSAPPHPRSTQTGAGTQGSLQGEDKASDKDKGVFLCPQVGRLKEGGGA